MESWKEFLRESEKVSIQMDPQYVGKWNDQAVAVNDADVLNIHNDARDFVLLLDKLAEHIGVPEPVITSGYRDAKRQTGPMLGIWVRNGGRDDALMGLKGSNNRGSDYIIKLYSECEERNACVQGAGKLAERLVSIWEENVNPLEERNAIPPEAFDATVSAIESNGGISMHQAGQSIDYGLSSNPVGAGHIKQLLDYISEFDLADMHVIDERVGVNVDGEEKAGDHWHITVRNLTPMGINFLKTSNYSIDAGDQPDAPLSYSELNESQSDDGENIAIGRGEAYIKHAALNLGMVYKNLKNMTTKHPQEDSIVASIKRRLGELQNDFKYTVLPPWTHHTEEDLKDLERNSVLKWFECGAMSDEDYKRKCLNESENPSWTEKSDFKTVYDAMLQFYQANPELMRLSADGGDWQEVQAKEVAKHGWTWAEYTERSEAEATAHERRIAINLGIGLLNESVKTIVRIEEEEFVEDSGTIVRKIKMYDNTGELVAQPTFSYHYLDPRRKRESPAPRPGWLERFLEILDWDLALGDNT